MMKFSFPSIFCGSLFSDIWPLSSDTIDIVLFKELNWAKIYRTTFVIYLWGTTLWIQETCRNDYPQPCIKGPHALTLHAAHRINR